MAEKNNQSEGNENSSQDLFEAEHCRLKLWGTLGRILFIFSFDSFWFWGFSWFSLLYWGVFAENRGGLSWSIPVIWDMIVPSLPGGKEWAREGLKVSGFGRQKDTKEKTGREWRTNCMPGYISGNGCCPSCHIEFWSPTTWSPWYFGTDSTPPRGCIEEVPSWISCGLADWTKPRGCWMTVTLASWTQLGCWGIWTAGILQAGLLTNFIWYQRPKPLLLFGAAGLTGL